ncbi:acetate kinase [Nitratidesulfovibrio sp. SRB-5]|uniref:acetate kinase n=1 Tax=Nitratidesulfovibrio sp. SRB-5 TaxID=2872636 RepID=UPI0010272CBB|nr:acetate kinase [Nitratidesulfovibrio sp. SRB-5]MBZ2171972.1 acetate kinase [Nitratidesulfovibrio sp. SRB-5]RXF78548.1 acetate kinase [Desulfovibrio sp. DS-1]
MNVLVINSGSSSIKYQLIDMTTEKALCSGLVERIGEGMGKLTHKIKPDTDAEEKIVLEQAFANHVEGMKKVVDLITDADKGVIADKGEIYAVGHRVLLGGEEIKQSVKIDEWAKGIIRDYIPLGPLHNPANLAGIEVAEELFPHAPSVGVFDTEFHQTMPKKAYLYPLPYDLYKTLRIRRYGFHGTSHRYITKKTAEFLGKPLDELNIITCHLGNGCSMAAVKNGRCVDTTMGITPLEGLMMGTRCGDIDPALVPFLMEKKDWSGAEIDTVMNKQSGLKGICGMNDMRDIHAAREKGDEMAELAFQMFVYRIRKYIGSFAVVVGKLDAIVFTAGIGENDDLVRAAVCKDMDILGIDIDEAVNAKRSGQARHIGKPGQRVPVLVVPTNEELEIAQTTVAVLNGKN